MRPARIIIWLAIAGLVVLAARAVAYALVPDPTARVLAREAAGPAVPVVVAGSLVAALGLSAVIVWLASLAVRERHLLSAAEGPPPRFDLRGLFVSGAGLFAAASIAFAALESFIHARAGLGLHAVSCLGGPVHRNAVPILAALAFLAAAFYAAARHLIAWARRTVGLLRRRLRSQPSALEPPTLVPTVLSAPARRPGSPRAPPAAAGS